MSENYTKVQQAFRVLHPLLAGYICQEMRREYQDNWWQEVLMTLSDQVRDLPNDNGDYAALMDSLDMANCLRLFDRKWNDLFKRKLSIDYRTWAKELMGVRNKLAHIGGTDFSEDDTWRALDTMARLCEAFDDEAAEEIRKILRQLRYGSAEGSTNVVEVAAPTKPKDPETRDRVCTQFSQLYQTNPSDFPPEVKEVEYRDRMISCYPIHPEIFDRLYDDWSTLERFQRTRGVLRLMAAVIHELWMGSDASAMIMPGSLSLDVPNVRDELIRYLPEGWNSIVNTEIDGKNSVPYQKDQSNQRYGRIMASRRVARTIMLGSAPTVRSQAVRGIEASRIRLGVVQPGENIADFNDALNTLRGSLAYLYTNTNGDRYWFDTRPTLRKTAQDRATQVAEADVIEEIESRLKKLRREEPFAGLHVCPASSLDVPDEQAARLVILRTEDTHRANAGASAAITAAENILNNHGSKPRTYRNMLTFVAPDQEAMLSLRQAVRDFRAWRSIQDDRETLNLDAAQNKEVDANLHRCNDTVEARIKETYCWLLIPEIDCFVDMKTIQWDASRISGGTDSIVAKASRKMQQSETLITKWAPALLLMELNNVLWKDTDCIQIKKLWEYLCTYCYLPRLAKYSVLEDAIRTGLNSQEYFALAAGYTGDRYVELRYNQFVDCINTSDLLVKLDPARKQLLAEKSAPAVVVQPTQTAQGGEQPTLFNLPPDAPIDPTVTLHQPPTAQPAAVPAPPKNTRFYMTAELDTTRINRDVQRLVEEVITHLLSADGCKVSVTLDVTADAPNGLSTPIVRTVMENCKTLKVKDFGVDE